MAEPTLSDGLSSPANPDEVLFARFIAATAQNSAAELARLAAMLAPKDEVFNADSLTRRAVELRDAAIAASIQHPADLLAPLDYAQLRALHGKIEALDGTLENPNGKRLDIVIGAMRTISQKEWHAWETSPERIEAKAAAEASLAEVEKISGPKPGAGSPVHEVLRWGAGVGPDISVQLVEEAFVCFLGVLSARRQLEESNRRGPSEAEEWFTRHQQVLTSGSLTPEQRQHSEDEMKRWAQERDAERRASSELVDFLDSLGPGGLPALPENLRKEAERLWVTYWRGSATDERAIHLIHTEFREFWNDHRDFYQEAHQEAGEIAKEVRARNTSNGLKGVDTNARNRWMPVLAAFVNWAGSQHVSLELAHQFPIAPGTSAKTGKKNRAFLRTLIKMWEEGLQVENLSGYLASEEISVSDVVAREIFEEFVRVVGSRKKAENNSWRMSS